MPVYRSKTNIYQVLHQSNFVEDLGTSFTQRATHHDLQLHPWNARDHMINIIMDPNQLQARVALLPETTWGRNCDAKWNPFFFRVKPDSGIINRRSSTMTNGTKCVERMFSLSILWIPVFMITAAVLLSKSTVYRWDIPQWNLDRNCLGCTNL